MKRLPESLVEEMFEDWLWEKYFDEIATKAITQVETEEGFWKSIWGVKKKVNDRRWKLFQELKDKIIKAAVDKEASLK